jgi:thiamine-phosphate pyrophosphorylase
MTAGLSRPIFCLVTERSRLSPATDSALVRLAGHAAAAGVTLIQIRERDADGGPLLSLTRAVIAAVAGTGAKVIVNDRTDVALAAGADGVHLRADSPPASQVRSIVPRGFLIGRSVHDDVEAVRAAGTGVDYLILGTIFPSAGKSAGTTWLGPEALERATRGTAIPVLAIGGITADKVGSIAAAGAAGVAAIGLFADLQRDATDDAVAISLRRLVGDLRAAFHGGAAAR